ncbi:MAG: NAD(+)/NADH kinase [Planctomycetaceae bacterium]|nr:NAD(+)/NADH kinase [Planctomycetaceae bacterium]
MAAARVPRVVLVTRPTDFERLVARHGTRAQAAFFLETRGQSIEEVEARHQAFAAGLESVLNSIPIGWRRNRIDRTDLDRFLFEPEDVVVALGQDGLVANVAKYLSGQAVIGLNPAPDLFEGVLVPHPPRAAPELLRIAVAGRGTYEERTMVEGVLDDGQKLLALNEIFVGHRTHQSSRYRLAWGEETERHPSSGVITATGTGSTGWARSIHHERASALKLPSPTSGQLVFFVREAWPSVATGTSLTQGIIPAGRSVDIVSEMDDDGVLFGDGIETDRIEFSWGRKVSLHAAPTRLRLLRG